MNALTEKIYYAAGPGDVVTTFRHWLQGEDDPRQFARTYSRQFFDVAEARDLQALVVSTGGPKDREEDNGISVINRPLPNPSPGLFGFLKRQFVSAFRLWKDLLEFRPQVAVIAEGTTYWALIAPLRIFGIRMVPSIHCVLWAPEKKRSRAKKMVDRIESSGLRLVSNRCLSASATIDRQLPEKMKSHRFLPTYLKERFEEISEPDFDAESFRLLYAGRVEEDKGVMDLLQALQICRNELKREIVLDVCGAGSALEAFRNEAERLGVRRQINLHGHCSIDTFRVHLGRSHVVVVPTTSRFVEGFNQVVVEGFLARRPVVATRVCPSAHDLSTGVEIVPPDSAELLADAIIRLAADRDHFQAMAGNDERIEQSDFFRQDASWAHQLDRILQGHAVDQASAAQTCDRAHSQ